MVLDDVDLFGYPEAEVREALGEPCPEVLLAPAEPGGHLRAVSFWSRLPPGTGESTRDKAAAPDLGY